MENKQLCASNVHSKQAKPGPLSKFSLEDIY